MTRPSARVRSGRAHRFVVLAAIEATLTACQPDLATSPEGADKKAPRTPPEVTTSPNPLASLAFYIDPSSKARKTADEWRVTRPADATQMDKIAAQPAAKWFGSWNTNVRSDVAAAVSVILSAGSIPVFVAYNIPQRDCGGLSGSNSLTPDAYRTWISEFAQGLGSSRAVVVLEPDALAAMTCLSTADQAVRLDLLKYAVSVLTTGRQALVYLDAGHPGWQAASTMASRLVAAGISGAAGFSLNVSNFLFDADNVEYGSAISSLVGNKHFIIDSGRNGLGPTSDYQWCNPDGRAIGRRPTTSTGNPLVDAYLWIKLPGESDGACNGAPAAGTWMPEYALGLASRG